MKTFGQQLEAALVRTVSELLDEGQKKCAQCKTANADDFHPLVGHVCRECRKGVEARLRDKGIRDRKRRDHDQRVYGK